MASDKDQKDNTKRLQSRARDVDKWKETLQRAIHAMSEEINTMEEQRRRLKQSLSVLRVPEAIGMIKNKKCSISKLVFIFQKEH